MPVIIGAIIVLLALVGIWVVIGMPTTVRDSVFKNHWLPTIIAVAVLVALPFGTFGIGTAVAKTDATTFYEYWSGYETSADSKTIQCTRDGGCANTYSCDPYTVTEIRTRVVSDGNGGTKTETYTEQVTKYHSCPYSTQETTYTVANTLGTHTVAANLMTGEQWRAGRTIPGGTQSAPQFWLDAKARIDAGKPAGVTKRNSYRNYIHASDDTLFKKYEGTVESYAVQGLLPKPAFADGFYNVSKVYNVQNAISDDLVRNYTENVSQVNAVFGDDLQGDLHVVFVPASFKADEYTNALNAYWTSREALGKNTVAKNSLTVIFGVNSSKVTWSRSFSGMPIGNEGLTLDFMNMKGVALDDNLIGQPYADLASGKIKHSDGLVESLLWGDNQFERVSMSGDGDEAAGFSYLMSDVKISVAAYVWMLVIQTVLSGITLFALRVTLGARRW